MSEDLRTGYGSTSATKGYGKQESLLSGPPKSVESVKTPKVVEQSSVSIVNQTYHLSKLVIYIYIIVGFVTIGLTIWGAFDEGSARWLLFFVIFLVTILLSLAGAFGMLSIICRLIIYYIIFYIITIYRNI